MEPGPQLRRATIYKVVERMLFDPAKTLPCVVCRSSSSYFFRHRWVLCIWFALSEKPQSLKLLTNRCKSLLSLFIPRGRFPLVGLVISAWSEYPLGTRNTELSHFCSSFIETIVTRLASHCSSVLAMQTREAMTIAACANFCDSQPVPYRFMGITDGFQCCASSSAQDMRLIIFGN